MPDLAEQLFGVPWNSLRLDDVQRFFSDPDTGEEGLTWEAKGGTFDAHHVRKTSCAFANSQSGGFLVLGVSGGRERPWAVDGMVIDGEPALRVGSIMRHGVQPVPAHDLRAWPLGNKTVLVLRVDPVALPPAITSQGQLYERVSGESIPVRDPGRLATLFARGQEARERASRASKQHAEEISDFVPDSYLVRAVALSPHKDYSDLLQARRADARLGLALTAVSYPDDVVARLFSSTFRKKVEGVVNELRAKTWSFPVGMLPPLAEHYRQECAFITGSSRSPAGHDLSLALGGTWDGSGTYGWVTRSEQASTARLVEDEIELAWLAVLEVVRLLGGAGEARLCLVIREAESWLDGPSGDDLTIDRSVALDSPSQEDLASVEREIARASGRRADEPPPEP